MIDCVISNNVAWYRGGGTSGGTTRNCRIVDNRLLWNFTWIGAYANGGSAVWAGTHYNALMAGNAGVGKWGSAVASWSTSPARLYNCTVVANTASSCAAGVDDSANTQKNTVLVNSIVALNTGTAKDSFLVATNSYVAVAGSAGVDSGCVYGDDPRLETLNGVAYVPRMGSPCKNAALPFDWMTNAEEVCSKDLAGNDRVIGGAPDIGCYERKGRGLLFIVR